MMKTVENIRKLGLKIVNYDMKDKEKKYCVGSPKMVAVPYIGQRDPVIIGTKEQVENWLDNFWRSIGCKK